MSKLKVGIIGVGGIAQVHIAAYRARPDVEIVAFCDINEQRLADQGKLHGVTRLYSNVEAMMQGEPDMDAVSVCTWNCAHAPCTIAALNAGKHVLCEKPMAMNVEEAEAMKAAAEKNGKLLMVGFVRRYGNDMAILKDFIDAGYFGDFYYAKVAYLRRNGNPGGWFGNKALSGGGPMIDLGVHVIDFVRYAVGNPKPVSVYGATFRQLGNRPNVKRDGGYLATSGDSNICDVEDLAVAMVRFDNGVVLNVETSFCLDRKEDCTEIELFGNKGGARISPELELFSTANGRMTNTQIAGKTALDFDGLFQGEIDHFIRCIVDNTPCCSPAQDGIELMKILTAVYKSAETGHEVVL